MVQDLLYKLANVTGTFTPPVGQVRDLLGGYTFKFRPRLRQISTIFIEALFMDFWF